MVDDVSGTGNPEDLAEDATLGNEYEDEALADDDDQADGEYEDQADGEYEDQADSEYEDQADGEYEESEVTPPGSVAGAVVATNGSRNANGSAWSRTGWQRLSDTFIRPPTQSQPRSKSSRPTQPSPDFAKLSDTEIRNLVNQIDPTERKIGLAASALAAVLAIVATVPFMISKTVVATTVKPVNKTCAAGLKYHAKSGTCNGVYPPSHYAFYLVVLLVFAIAIFVTVRIGRRAPVAFAVTLTGLAIGTVLASLIIVLPFLVAGGWLLLRAWRSQRYGSPTSKAPIEGYVRPAPGGGRGGVGRAPSGRASGPSGGARGSTGSSRGRSRRRGQPEEVPGTRKPPAANKRYTPKAPPRKRPLPPS